MGMFDELKNKAEKLAHEHPEQLEKISDQVIERGGDAADKVTDHKFTHQIDGVEQKADDAI